MPTRFAGLVQGRGIPPRYQLDFEYTVVDLGIIEDDRLSAHPTLRAGLLALKYATRPAQQRVKLDLVLRAVAATSPEFQRTAVIYILETYRRIPGTAVIEAARRILPAGETVVRSILQQWEARGERKGKQEGIAEGIREGIKEGIKEGRREGIKAGIQKGIEKGVARGRREGELDGERKIVRKQLERRFGPLAREHLARLRAADSALLDEWSERLLDAPDLETVFADRARGDAE